MNSGHRCDSEDRLFGPCLMSTGGDPRRNGAHDTSDPSRSHGRTANDDHDEVFEVGGGSESEQQRRRRVHEDLTRGYGGLCDDEWQPRSGAFDGSYNPADSARDWEPFVGGEPFSDSVNGYVGGGKGSRLPNQSLRLRSL